MDDLIKKVWLNISKHSLIKENELVAVALSGGADSVFLFTCLIEIKKILNFKLCALHVEHGLRGYESVNDMKFVQKLCKDNDVELYIHRAKLKNASELCARNARYAFFESCIKEYGIDKIAVAHNADDKSETMLLNLIRGSGAAGLNPLNYSKGKYIRPLLNIYKSEILKYSEENSVDFAVDSTNFQNDYQRNKLRNDIIPKMQEINPNAQASFARAMNIFSAEDDFLNSLTDSVIKKICRFDENYVTIERKAFNSEHLCIKRRVLRECFKSLACLYDLEFSRIEDIIALSENNASNKQLNLHNNIVAFADYKFLVLAKKGTEVFFNSAEFEKTMKLSLDNLPDNNLKIRTRQTGDYIYPLGMQGKKMLKDYFSDKKIPKHLRDNILLLAHGCEVFAVFGVGISRKCAIDKETKCTFEINI